MIPKIPPFKQVYPDISEADVLAQQARISLPAASWSKLHAYIHKKTCTVQDLRLMLTLEANRRRFTTMGSYARPDVMRRIITRLAKIESLRLRKLLGMGGMV